ncbi:4-hydroxy-tetrahydrodipicolinate synthase [Kribbella amoyensis]|uniref:4-hydroxy-tetrahydrodipicolinate synthase n=1 Tax=Kribbella amoyensis TaxID=996641 RepID=A0A561B2W7_9ACTN|nr:dihydrodipicolinate synthase family protein [Kribbella amoyensis]TWD73213.1 4-hydroxy-tetrahydrodipicolinate synthase [Kribbella amoyensis]
MLRTPATAVTETVVETLRSGVTAAALTPFDAAGAVRIDAVAGYAGALAGGGAGALAVCVHTGRGPWLPDERRAEVVAAYRVASELPLVAGVGIPAGADLADPVGALLRNAEPVVAAGASALLCFPPPRVPEYDRAVVELHERLAAETGLPVIAFALYEKASGNQYDAATAARLVTVPGVVGLKLALLDDAIGCQDLIAGCRTANPDALLLTGEDRMLGPSLMWGARGMLIGLAAAVPSWSVAVNQAWNDGRYDDFVAASTRLDQLAALVFRAPMEGYVQRMAWIAAWEGILDPEFCHDPYGPPSDPAERDELLRAMDRLASRELR